MVQNLDRDWLTKGHIDFEYKQYILLAYLKYVQGNFQQQRLYPSLAELIAHYENILQYEQEKKAVEEYLPKELKGLDLKSMQLLYEQKGDYQSVLEEVDRIVSFSGPAMKRMIEEGKEIYEAVEEQLTMHPIGVLPPDLQTGYLWLVNGHSSKVAVYEYQLSLLSHPKTPHRGLLTRQVMTIASQWLDHLDKAKTRLMDKLKLMVHPACYLWVAPRYYPEVEMLVPIVKRKMLQYLSMEVK